MSKAAPQTESSKTADTEPPEIESDLVKEELRIDGICGVY
ncbi:MULTISPECIES: mycofactocin precursor MftA [Halodesulfurarchaeum]